VFTLQRLWFSSRRASRRRTFASSLTVFTWARRAQSLSDAETPVTDDECIFVTMSLTLISNCQHSPTVILGFVQYTASAPRCKVWRVSWIILNQDSSKLHSVLINSATVIDRCKLFDNRRGVIHTVSSHTVIEGLGAHCW